MLCVVAQMMYRHIRGAGAAAHEDQLQNAVATSAVVRPFDWWAPLLVQECPLGANERECRLPWLAALLQWSTCGILL